MIHSILLSATKASRSISLILSKFEGVLVPRKHSSILQIKAKFSLAFIHALIVLLGSFLLVARSSAVCEKRRLHSLVIFPQHENTSGVKDPCSTWRIRCYTPVSFRFHYFYKQLEDYGVNGIWLMGWKPLCHKRPLCPLIHDPLAYASAHARLQVFKDFGSSSPVNSAGNGSITTFLQTSPRVISAVSFHNSLYLVITSSPFGQDKTCRDHCTHMVLTQKLWKLIKLWLNS